MALKIYQIDAFATKNFEGNPAAVVPLDHWISDKVMQKISEENNLSETAFFIRDKDDYHIRWFTPKKEVDLCGHATLASAFVIFKILKVDRAKNTKNSKLNAQGKSEDYTNRQNQNHKKRNVE